MSCRCIPNLSLAGKHATAEIQFEVVIQDIDLPEVEPLTIVDRERQCEPVGYVDEALVLHQLTGHPERSRLWQPAM